MGDVPPDDHDPDPMTPHPTKYRPASPKSRPTCQVRGRRVWSAPPGIAATSARLLGGYPAWLLRLGCLRPIWSCHHAVAGHADCRYHRLVAGFAVLAEIKAGLLILRTHLQPDGAIGCPED